MRLLHSANRRDCLVRTPIICGGGLLFLAALLTDLVSGSWHGFGVLQWGMLALGTLMLLIGVRASRPAVARLNLGLAATAGMVLIADLALRCVLPIPGRGAGEWAGSPGSRVLLVSAPDKFRAVHRYNTLGFRGPEVLLTPTTPHRIVCIGDSWTEGVGADEEQSWPAVLQRTLPSARCEVINLGDSGSQPDRYLEILAHVGVPLHPTHAIICVIPSDFMGGPEVPLNLTPRDRIVDAFRERGSLLKNGIAWSLPGWTYLWDRSRGRWNTRQGLFWDRWDQRRDALMIDQLVRRDRISGNRARELVAQRLGKISPACLQAAQVGEFNGARIVLEVVVPQASFAARVEDMGIGADDLADSTRVWVQWYADTCHSRRIVPILLFFPEAGLVSDAPAGPVEDENLVGRPSLTHDHSLSDLLSAICRDAGIKFLDCTPALRAATGNEPLFLRYDHHPTARAYDIAARYVANELLSEEFKTTK